ICINSKCSPTMVCKWLFSFAHVRIVDVYLVCNDGRVSHYYQWSAKQVYTLDLRFVASAPLYGLLVKMSLLDIAYDYRELDGFPPAFTTILGDPLTFPATTAETTTVVMESTSDQTTTTTTTKTIFNQLPNTTPTLLHYNFTSTQHESSQTL